MPHYCFTCLLVVIAAGAALADPPTTKWKDDAWGLAVFDGVPPINQTRCGAYGYVWAIDKDGITLYRPSLEAYEMRHDPESGALLWMSKKERFPSVPPKTFLLCDDLAGGGWFEDAHSSNTYRIRDVKTGDRVDIEYNRRNGVDICQQIQIRRRPGGLVPPAPGEKPNEFLKHHERMNADQDWEEFGIPYPPKYFNEYMKNGLFYATQYRTRTFRSEILRAPAPREVKPPGPARDP